jgi:hypothetical protein
MRTATLRLLRLELRHNAMAWMAPVVIALFWLTTYRKTVAAPPMWNLRAADLQMGSVIDFVAPLAGAAAWMGSREHRRRVTDVVTITPRARWARLLATWAATTIWAMVTYVGCVTVLYGITARQASWGGPLWWPAAVAAASLPAFTALGFAAGVLLPSRFTAPVAAIAAFFVLVLSTELITGSHSYWQVTPIVTGPWNVGSNAGVATFYHYLPDLPIAQVMFLAGLTIALLGALALPAGSGGRSLRVAAAGLTTAGLLAAGSATWLAGTGSMDSHGMIDIPALHDAANDQPIQFTPVCSHTAIPVCLNPAYASYLSATAAALEPVLNEMAGLPGAPVRILQEAAIFRSDPDGGIAISAGARTRGASARTRGGSARTRGGSARTRGGTSRVYHLLLPDQLPGPAMTAGQMASQIRWGDGSGFVASFIGDGAGASQAQDAVAAAMMMAIGQPRAGASHDAAGQPGLDLNQLPGLRSGAAHAAAERFAALPASVRHAWLAGHLAALRAGQITLAQLP